MSVEKPLWGAQNIHGELLKLGIQISQATVARYMVRRLLLYHRTRSHLSLDKDCPDRRPIQLRKTGSVIAIPKLGGLHHRYQRMAA